MDLEKPSSSALSKAMDVYFDEASVARGQEIAESGKVVQLIASLESGQPVLDGLVQGSDRFPYETNVRWLTFFGDLQIFSRCSCPVRNQCKHGVAVLLHWVHTTKGEGAEAQPGAAPRPQSSPRTLAVLPVLAKPLDKKIANWLRQLESDLVQQPAASGNRPVAPSGRLGFMIMPSKTRFRLEVYYGPNVEGKDQTFHLMYDLNGVSRRKHNLFSFSDEDVAIARELSFLRDPAYKFQVAFEGAEGSRLLQRLVASGYCSVGVPPNGRNGLKLGFPRTAEPVWRADVKGIQRTALIISPGPAELLRLTPPWYLDLVTQECGPVETNIPPAAIDRWLAAPPIKPDQTDLVSATLARRITVAKLPTPTAVTVQHLQNVLPVPCLKLATLVVELTPSAYYYSYNKREPSQIELSVAMLSFDYNGLIVASHDKRKMLEGRSDDMVMMIDRDLGSEAEAVQALRNGGLGTLANQFPDMKVEHNAHDWTSEEESEGWYSFMESTLPGLQQAGWRVEIDPSFRDHILTVEDYYTDAQGGSNNAWFDLELGVMVKGERVNLLPLLLKVISSSREFTPEALAALPDDVEIKVKLPEGGILALPAARIRQLLGVILELWNPAALNKDGRLRLPKLRVAELLGDTTWRWHGQEALQELATRLKSFQGIRKAEMPKGLAGELRPYQAEGVSWLQFLREFELGGILADDMGLGKTVQTLAHLLIEKEAGRMDKPSLIVAPTSLMTNWRREAEKFAPDLKVLVLHGLDRKQEFDKIAKHDLVITSYPLLPRDEREHLKHEYHYIILDEAQFIKNPKTTYAQTACILKARHRLCLTGTPMENHLGELWSIFNFLLPGFLGDETRFNATFRRPIEKGGHDERRKVLARRVAPFLLRRRKAEVVKELPPKTEIVQNVELEGAQRDLYETVRLTMQKKVRDEIAKKGMSRSHIIILDALLKLRQICCDPRLVKLPSAKKVKESAKLEMLMDLLPEMIDEGRRILVFSQFTSMLALIEEALTARKIKYVMLTGDTTDRATPVDRFQKGEVPVFLLSLKAGGTGLNLTAADTVIHYDPWWNPAVENQATDRAHRIGQSKNVFVYKLMTVGTVEEKIAQMQARKRELVEGLFSEDRKQGVQLTSEDLDVLFAPLK